jgi:hypothetical protein
MWKKEIHRLIYLKNDAIKAVLDRKRLTNREWKEKRRRTERAK